MRRGVRYPGLHVDVPPHRDDRRVSPLVVRQSAEPRRDRLSSSVGVFVERARFPSLPSLGAIAPRSTVLRPRRDSARRRGRGGRARGVVCADVGRSGAAHRCFCGPRERTGRGPRSRGADRPSSHHQSGLARGVEPSSLGAPRNRRSRRRRVRPRLRRARATSLARARREDPRPRPSSSRCAATARICVAVAAARPRVARARFHPSSIRATRRLDSRRVSSLRSRVRPPRSSSLAPSPSVRHGRTQPVVLAREGPVPGVVRLRRRQARRRRQHARPRHRRKDARPSRRLQPRLRRVLYTGPHTTAHAW